MTAFAHAEQTTRPLQAQRRCLVLNADGRPLSTWPLSIIDARDAIHAWFRDRVSVVETWPGEFFRSPSTRIEIPKTIMLRDFAPVSANPKFCRRSILLRDRYRCQYCGEQFPSHELTFDHVIPRSAGGTTVWENILTACLKCNSAKANKPANYSGRKGTPTRPFKMPRRPTSAELLRNGLAFLPNDVRDTWSDFLYWQVELQP